MRPAVRLPNMTGPQDLDAGEQAFYAALNAPVPGEEPGAVTIWQMTEEQLLTEVLARCLDHDVSRIHIDNPGRNRRRDDLPGFPDLFLIGRNGIAFRELKKQWHFYASGDNLSSRQVTWKYRLLAAGQSWGVWKPSHLADGTIDRELVALGGR
jgi:hypothetical protein